MFLSNTSRTKFSEPIIIKEVETGKTLEFSSIINIVNHFKTVNITMDRNKITKIVNTGELYKGYLFIK